jgi:2-polyprenyl-3-methyl-5-hydroxy-6-metoxy-1,4-benzoquinol methylase
MNSAEQLDVEKLMQEIKAKVVNEINSNKLVLPKFVPSEGQFDSNKVRIAGELVQSSELRHLNFNFNKIPYLTVKEGHRKNFVGKIVFKLKKRLAIWLSDLLGDFFSEQTEYRANNVRFLNSLSTYIDARDSSQFWELIRKIDVDNENAVSRIEAIHQELSANIIALESKLIEQLDNGVRKLEKTVNSHSVLLTTLDQVCKGLEFVAQSAPKQVYSSPQSSVSTSIDDPKYYFFENRFRGSEQEVKEKLAWYPDLFIGKKNILEIGPGRGELLELFREKGVFAKGVDIDSMMVSRCKSKSLDVVEDNAITFLKNTSADSFEGIIALEVVEHIPAVDLDVLLHECFRCITPGGILVLETIDPRCLLALTSQYFRDPTHVMPLHPDTLKYMAEMRGFVVEEVKQLSPVADEEKLQLLKPQEFFTPKLSTMLDDINKSFLRVNAMLYSHQEYCIIARKP